MVTNLPFKKLHSSGQALLLVLIGMGAALVLVLSIVSRSITDISLSSKDDESSRAFSAAEAGIEKLLIGNSLPEGGLELSNNSFVSGASEDLAKDQTQYNLPEDVVSGGYGTVWFVRHDSSGKMSGDSVNPRTLKICWGKDGLLSSDLTSPAIEVSIYYSTDTLYQGPNPDYKNVKVYRAAFDPLDSSKRDNNFTKVGSNLGCTVSNNIGSKKYSFYASVDNLDTLLSNVLFVRLKMLYNPDPQPIGVDTGTVGLPSQGFIYTTTGTSGTSTRKVQVIQTFKDVMPFIDDGLYSGSSIEK